DPRRTASLNVTVTGAPTPAAITRWVADRVAYQGGPIGEVVGMWGPNATNVFAVTFEGEIARYDGTSWSLSQSGAGTLQGITGTSATDVWAVNAEGRIWHFNGSAWTNRASPRGGGLYAIHAVNATSAFAVGDSGTVLRFDGTNWTQIAGVPNTQRPLFAV